jgi:hypothetical protein
MKKLDIGAFVGRNSKDIRGPEIFAAAKALKLQYKKVGAVGYCYGGWAAFRNQPFSLFSLFDFAVLGLPKSVSSSRLLLLTGNIILIR